MGGLRYIRPPARAVIVMRASILGSGKEREDEEDDDDDCYDRVVGGKEGSNENYRDILICASGRDAVCGNSMRAHHEVCRSRLFYVQTVAD